MLLSPMTDTLDGRILDMAAPPKPKARIRAAKTRSTPTSTLTAESRRVLQVLRRRGWSVQLASAPQKLLPAGVGKRYRSIPADVEAFLSALERCVSPKETVWFLTADDYARKRGVGFRWNDFELMMLEGAEGDPALQAEYRSRWDGHFPVMFAVHSDYDYLAVRLSDGAIVHGYGPAWEEPERVASSFAALLRALADDKRRERYPWSLFVGKKCA